MKVASRVYSTENVPYKLSLLLFFRYMWNRNYTLGREYRPDELHHYRIINDTERLNENLKYKELKGATRSVKLSLSEILNNI